MADCGTERGAVIIISSKNVDEDITPTWDYNHNTVLQEKMEGGIKPLNKSKEITPIR